MPNRSVLALLISLLAQGACLAEEGPLRPLPYNHPGLQVDLGVGLWAWPVPCDADGDGDFDLIVSCPDSTSNGVWLFRNESGDTAADKMPVFAPAERLSSTAKYVMPSYVDGGLRVLSPGWEYPSFITRGIEDKISLPVDANFYKAQGTQPAGPKVRHNQWRLVDYDGDDALDIIVGIEDWSYYGWDDAWSDQGQWENGPLHGFVLLLRNTGTSTEPKYAEPQQVLAGGQPVDVVGCPSPNFEDFDADGDLDLLCGEFLDGFTFFENTGSRTQPEYAPGKRLRNASGDNLVMDLQMIVPVAFDWDRDGDADLIVGDEDGRVALIENTGDLDPEGVPLFADPQYFQQRADTLKSGALATPVGTDWDGDGDYDLLSGNTAGYIEFFENLSGPGVEFPRWSAPIRLHAGDEIFRIMAGHNGSIQGPAEAKWGYTTLSVADWNGDQLPDILFNSIWGRVQWLENIGSRTKPRLAEAQDIVVAWNDAPQQPAWQWWTPTATQLTTQWRTTPLAIDWTQDGRCDLVMLDHEGYLALFERDARTDALLPPQRVFRQQVDSGTHLMRLNAGEAGRSGRRKLSLVDWDGDGRLDILANSENANLLSQIAVNDTGWTFADSGPLVEQNIQGHSTSPTTVDFNADGIPDLVAGAENGRLYYWRNPRTK